MTLQVDRLPDVDYEAHPAFAGLPAADAQMNARAEALIAEIDSTYDEAVFADDPRGAFDRTVLPHILALETLVQSQPVPPVFAPFLANALENARNNLRRDITARGSARSNSASEELPGKLRDGLESFRRDGYFETCDKDLADLVWRSTWIERAILRARAARDPSRHAALALHSRSPAVRAIRRATLDSGLIAFVSAYLGKPVTLYYACLDYAHAGQSWYKGCYAANGLDDSKTVYMHLDADVDIIKALFYLKDVSRKDGPFCFVRGSHLWGRSKYELSVRKGFDEASAAVFPLTPEQLDYVQGYYRPRFQIPDYKAGMLALPRALRGSSHFGDDVIDGSALSEALLREEKTFTSPAGTMVIFDGSSGIHRGSLTETNGERWAVQLAFKFCDSNAPAKPFKALRDLVGYLRYCVPILKRLAAGKG